jgi:hypothetical protein
MKIYLLLVFLIVSNSYGYVDMSDTVNRANDLNMTSEDYAYAMAISGLFTGSMFGLFLWKSR